MDQSAARGTGGAGRDAPDGVPAGEAMDRAFAAEVLRPVFGDLVGPGTEGEGLRDRKKRLLRQRISNTATGMFLERGFHEVKVSEIAEACEVSEKTVFNYFPTKESLLFDREDYEAALITEAVRDHGDDRSLVDTVVQVIEADVTASYQRWSEGDTPDEAMAMLRRFGALVEETPALQAYLQGMSERLTQVAAEALAERAGVDPDGPEPQLAAAVVMALRSEQYRAMRRHAVGAGSFDEVRDGVLDDVRRAARVADAGLSSFNLVVQRDGSTREQLREAAVATNEARKQVVAAVKQARDAWKKVVAEAKAAHHADEDRQAAQRELRARQQELRAEIRERQAELRRQQVELRRQQSDGRRQRGGPGQRPGGGRGAGGGAPHRRRNDG
jgi:AcrR family transcriptional regulator